MFIPIKYADILQKQWQNLLYFKGIVPGNDHTLGTLENHFAIYTTGGISDIHIHIIGIYH